MARIKHVSAQLANAHIPRSILAVVLTLLLAWTFCAFPLTAAAEDIDTDPAPDELQQRIESTAAEVEAAKADVEAADKAIKEHRARIAELEKLIPEQQERSDKAARELYKMSQATPGILELLLDSENFFDFLSNLDYINRISDQNIAEINKLKDMKDELNTTTAELEQAKETAVKRAADAESALAEAQAARLEAQRKAQETARQEAEAAAAAASAAGAAGGGAAAAGGDAGAGAEDGGASASTPAVTPVDDGADWTEDEAAFIASWAPRIDAYLAGSPLAGQGMTFARAAWEYGVDPRWSPAISCVESTKGAYCFLPHNAWGWGSVSWDSWEEAIDAHVRGLARGYGYTVSYEAAQKYCPPNADFWYQRCLEEMAKI